MLQHLRRLIFRSLRGRRFIHWPGIDRLRAAAKRRRATHSVVHGFPVELDEHDVLGLSLFGDYEPHETALVKREVRPGDTALDLGANIGYYTLLLSQLVGDSGRVYAFEPSPGTFEILQRNITANARTNVELVRAAVGDVDKDDGDYFLDPDNIAGNHGFDVGGGGTTVPTRFVTLDSYLPRDVSVDFIKMDIEGAEPAAIEGMQRVIRRSPNLRILFEFWPKGIERAGKSPGHLLERIQELGFCIQRLDRTAGQLMPCSAAEALTMPLSGKERYAYLFCTQHGG